MNEEFGPEMSDNAYEELFRVLIAACDDVPLQTLADLMETLSVVLAKRLRDIIEMGLIEE